jgi:putative ABC transport system ATP-binding protein
MSSEPLLTARNVLKNYHALRPLRIEALTLSRGDVLAITGLDAAAAEILVGLLTGAMLPDSGEIQLFGRPTSSVRDSDSWLALLDGIGIVTDRAVLIPQFSVEQNVAMPFTLDVDPVDPDVRPRVLALAQEVGLKESDVATAVGQALPDVQVRVRLARALALDPSVLLAEHPSATLPRAAVNAFASDLSRVARARQLAVLAMTADDAFARALGGQVLTHEPATGALRPASAWRKIFQRS